jgi:phosphatidylserine synthase
MSNQYQKKSRVKKRFIPNILTLVNMFLGFLAIVLILDGDPMKGGIFILIAAIFDFFDGKIARKPRNIFTKVRILGINRSRTLLFF